MKRKKDMINKNYLRENVIKFKKDDYLSINIYYLSNLEELSRRKLIKY